MKKSIYALAFVVLAFSLNSCDWFEEAASPDFTFETALPVDLKVDVDEAAIEKTIVLDPLSDEQIERYKDEIKGMEIQSLGYKVTELRTDNETLIFNGDIEFSIGAGSPIHLASLEGVDIKALAASGEEQTLELPSAVVEQIAATLEAQNEVTLYLSGELNEVPANFDMELVVHLEVTTEVEL